jgi:hypothetical protein
VSVHDRKRATSEVLAGEAGLRTGSASGHRAA